MPWIPGSGLEIDPISLRVGTVSQGSLDTTFIAAWIADTLDGSHPLQDIEFQQLDLTGQVVGSVNYRDAFITQLQFIDPAPLTFPSGEFIRAGFSFVVKANERQ